VRRCLDDDRGSGTVVVVGVCLAALVLLTFVGWLGSAVVARHRAAAAADLAALAAADVLVGRADGAPCDTARRIALAGDDVTLTSCRTEGRVAVVTVAVLPSGWVASVGSAVATARAGPSGGDLPPR
jgi:secretion/DNA translocation related TadE-like protein